jgi:serine phosphatase RsbU (regulator of sigma subunit)
MVSMLERSPPISRWFMPLLGTVAAVFAVVSIVDMTLPRPYDGVVLEADAPGRLLVRSVVPGSGAFAAGLQPGDEIVGIARSAVRSTAHVALLMTRHAIGDEVPYLLRRHGRLSEVVVRLGPRRIGSRAYLWAAALGASFFLIGLFVLRQRPNLSASQVFFLLCCLLLTFLVCRLRPASYSTVDSIVLSMGTAALVLLPASFLHFFIIFPRPIWEAAGGRPAPLAWTPEAARRALWIAYAVPPLVLIGTLLWAGWTRRPPAVLSGAPKANWSLLLLYMPLGLASLATNARRLPSSDERRGSLLVLAGAVFGFLPFLGATLFAPGWVGTDRFVWAALLPLALVPLSFAYAIVRYSLFDVRVILRKSLLYTGTTAAVTIVYALAVASFNTIFRGSTLAASSYFPLLFALAIVLLFEPLRRQVQGPIDRFFFAGRLRLQSALIELGEAFTVRLDPSHVVRDLAEELPRLLGLRFAALYLLRQQSFEKIAGPKELPATLPLLDGFYRQVESYTTLTRLDDLAALRLASPQVHAMIESLRAAGVEAVGDLASSRRRIGLMLLSGRAASAMPLEEEELRLLRGLLHQAAIALETSQLLEERTRQAELERELEIAAQIQRHLIPPCIDLGPQWEVAATCRPARHVGGDFYAEIAGPSPSGRALIFGDVAGKSVPGALLMMAAKEALHALALAHSDPEDMLHAANHRLYQLANRSFVALGYLLPNGNGMRYALAGQPQPMIRRRAGGTESLPAPEHRLPLGAMLRGRHRLLETSLDLGDILLLFSDGVIEAHAPDGEFFGEERLGWALAQGPDTPQEMVRHVLATLDEFTAGHDPYDDITLIAVARRSAPQEIAHV